MVVVEDCDPSPLAGVRDSELLGALGERQVAVRNEHPRGVIRERRARKPVDVEDVQIAVVVEVGKELPQPQNPCRTPAWSVTSSNVPSPWFR